MSPSQTHHPCPFPPHHHGRTTAGRPPSLLSPHLHAPGRVCPQQLRPLPPGVVADADWQPQTPTCRKTRHMHALGRVREQQLRQPHSPPTPGSLQTPTCQRTLHLCALSGVRRHQLCQPHSPPGLCENPRLRESRTFMPLAGSVSTSSAPKARSRMRRSMDMEAGMVRISL